MAAQEFQDKEITEAQAAVHLQVAAAVKELLAVVVQVPQEAMAALEQRGV